MDSLMVAKDSKYPLSNGHEIPVSGFGVFQIPADRARDVVYEALKIGYRHIDSARDYGNEKESAEGIAKFLSEFREVRRRDIFFTSKIQNRVQTSYEESVSQLQESWDRCREFVGYFDLFLVHCTYPNKETRLNQYKALQDFVDRGAIRSIGVSNYGTRHLDELMNWEGLRYKPVINQLELQPWLPRIDLQLYGKKHGILLEAYSPLTQGKRFNDPEIVAIAEKHGKTPAEILLRWSYDQGFIPISKSVTISRISANFNVLDHVFLDDADKKILDKPTSYEVLGWDPTIYIDP
uniref:Aldo-keto reductase n=1 Tax=Cyberlindnera americana TaxID=36016 RepID=A0A5P8N8S5_9ASCO|nr:aldo-keto reductase [Cyberlindnera americana]